MYYDLTSLYCDPQDPFTYMSGEGGERGRSKDRKVEGKEGGREKESLPRIEECLPGEMAQKNFKSDEFEK